MIELSEFSERRSRLSMGTWKYFRELPELQELGWPHCHTHVPGIVMLITPGGGRICLVSSK